MNRRRPPAWPHYVDPVADECRVATVTFGTPIPTGTPCHYCGGVAESRDHIVADSAGGSALWWNLVPSCVKCNVEKADRQSCSCLFCLRAMALWHLGYRRTGKSHREKRLTKKAKATLKREELIDDA